MTWSRRVDEPILAYPVELSMGMKWTSGLSNASVPIFRLTVNHPPPNGKLRVDRPAMTEPGCFPQSAYTAGVRRDEAEVEQNGWHLRQAGGMTPQLLIDAVRLLGADDELHLRLLGEHQHAEETHGVAAVDDAETCWIERVRLRAPESAQTPGRLPRRNLGRIVGYDQ